MKKLLIILFLSSLTILGYGKKTDPIDYFTTTIKIIRETNIINKLKTDTLFISVNGLPLLVADTLIDNIRLTFRRDKEEIFFWGANYWFETVIFEQSLNKIEYGYCLNSFRKIDNFDYIAGRAIFARIDNKWDLKSNKFKSIAYDKIPKPENLSIEQPNRQKIDYKICYNFQLDKIENREINNLSDTIIGDWYSSDKSEFPDYTEYLFINDSIYHFTYSFEGLPPMRYEIIDNQLIINRFQSDTIYLTIKVIDIKTIHLSGLDTTYIQNQDMRIDTIDFTIKRLPESEIKFSDINCWREKENEEGEIVYNKQTEKFRNEFYKRANINFE